MRIARGSRSAQYVVSFDIPDNCGVTSEPSGEPGHVDIRGDLEEVKRYLRDGKVDVDRRDQR